jgi:hypothetical protein
MMKRKLIDGTEALELSEPITLIIKTKCPEKWILIDRETGETYTGYSTPGKNSWKKTEIPEHIFTKYNA